MFEFVIRVARNLAFIALDSLLIFCRSERTSDVAIVRVDGIGDFVLWLDSARSLRAIYPQRRIVLITSAACAELAESLPFWDEVLPVEPVRLYTDPLYRWRFLRRLRERGFSTAVQPTFSRATLAGDSLIRATGAKERIGSTGDLSNMNACQKPISDRWYTELLPTTPALANELERNANFVLQLGCASAQPEILPLPVNVIREELRNVAPYFVVVPGAAWDGRRWPTANFAKVIREISGSTGWLPVLSGSKDEIDLCRQVAELARADCAILTGRTSLVEFIEIIRGAAMLISNETSAVHIAAAVSTPSICVLGGGHYGRYLPYPEGTVATTPTILVEPMPCFGCNWRCHLPLASGGTVQCIARIAPERVSLAARAIIERITQESPQ